MSYNDIIAIIPAHRDLKGFYNKNIINFYGHPLITWTIEQAKNSNNINEIFVVTDNKEIAVISKEYGASVILSPGKLANYERIHFASVPTYFFIRSLSV